MTRPSLLLATVRPTPASAEWLTRHYPGIEEVILESAPAARQHKLLDCLRRPWDCIAIYAEHNDPLNNILLAISPFLRAKRLIRLHHDGTVESLSRREGLRYTIGVLFASLIAWLDLLRINLALLAAAPGRSPPHRMASGHGILYVNSGDGQRVGGALSHMVGVVNALAAEGHRIKAVCDAEASLFYAGVVLHRLPDAGRTPLPPEAAIYSRQRALSNLLERIIRTDRPAAIYQRLTIGAWAGMFAARRHGIPFLLEYNGSETWISQNWLSGLRFPRTAARIENACIGAADLIVTVSAPLRDELRGKGVPEDRIVVAPNGVDIERFDPQIMARLGPDWRQQQGIPAYATVAAFVGSFGPWHGATVPAKAAKQISINGQAPGLVFLFVGNGPEKQACEAYLTDLPGGTLRMVGSVSPTEIPAVLAAADILVAPHVPMPDGRPFFGSPTKLFEYMAAGKAIVASDLDQIGEVLAGSLRVGDIASAGQNCGPSQTSACAVLTKPGDATELAAALVGLAKEPALRHTLGRNARIRAERFHTWSRHAELILDAGRRIGLPFS